MEDGTMTAVVSSFVGKRMWAYRRAADMANFQFGARKNVRSFRGEPKIVGEFALHVQCAWRLVKAGTLIVGSQDLYYPADYRTEESVPPEFDWSREPNRLDRLIRDLFEDDQREFIVKSIEIQSAGACRVTFDQELTLDVMPVDSLPGEYWRLFETGPGGRHIVMTDRGLLDG